MSISPTKESHPSLASRNVALFPPPSPHTHRLRRLQSAQNLTTESSRSNTQSSMRKQPSRNFSPVRREPSSQAQTSSSHQRMRSNSDAPIINATTTGSYGRKQGALKKVAITDALSLDRLIRDGPQGGDLAGALETARLKILDQGIKSDSDGMVC